MTTFTRLNFVPSYAAQSSRDKIFLTLAMIFLLAACIWHGTKKETVASLHHKIANLKPTLPAKLTPRHERGGNKGDAEIKAVEEAVRQLNLPVVDLIKTIQPAKDIHIALLSLDVTGKANNSGETKQTLLKITAEAKTPQEMMTYTEFLADKPIFDSVYLTKHELNAASMEKPYRFSLEAQWHQ